ncbi:hypothetical protein FKP32DRAFT_1602074 [Trametes sanguinea]|nr:hypothetical protein FKP32DRAFT_1602074 [Trametes sanguinea]
MSSTTRNTRAATHQSDRPTKRLKGADDDSSPTSSDSSTTIEQQDTTSIATATPVKTTNNATLKVPDWVSEDTISRLNDFLRFAEPETNRFAVAHVPSSTKWGNKEFAKYLCLDDKPVTVWLVGSLVSKWFQNRMGEPQDTVNVAIEPLREIDLSAAITLLSNSQPRKVPTLTRLYAKRFMTEWSAGDAKPKVVLFDKIYDATKGFGRKASLPPLYPSELGIGDIVLVEVAVTRYKTGTIKYRWEQWNVSFELLCISVIAHSPSAPTTTKVTFEPNDSDVRL